MKLRLARGSLRLRVSAAEVRALAARGRIEERIALHPERALALRLSIARDAERLRVVYEGDVIDVQLPESDARAWCASDLVALEAPASTGAASLRILVEKDFDAPDSDPPGAGG
ncbi:MAG TPA: hypothetical protein VMU67_05725 [Steroidobacteraceae bacterium]|nr:hypothetical protein [Steroidobacteraceae bacterium]